jgi:hypothetical protein
MVALINKNTLVREKVFIRCEAKERNLIFCTDLLAFKLLRSCFTPSLSIRGDASELSYFFV